MIGEISEILKFTAIIFRKCRTVKGQISGWLKRSRQKTFRKGGSPPPLFFWRKGRAEKGERRGGSLGIGIWVGGGIGWLRPGTEPGRDGYGTFVGQIKDKYGTEGGHLQKGKRGPGPLQHRWDVCGTFVGRVWDKKGTNLGQQGAVCRRGREAPAPLQRKWDGCGTCLGQKLDKSGTKGEKPRRSRAAMGRLQDK